MSKQTYVSSSCLEFCLCAIFYSTPSEILHSLPVELVRIVFEDAASRSRASALSLVCVSKMVQKWITPFLYRTVVLETPRALLSFCETIVAEKSDLACYTKSLYLPSPLSLGVPSFLNNFAALQHLAIGSLSLRDPLRSSLLHGSPCPTSITITGPLSRISFRKPIFQRCTHLYLADDVPWPFSLTTDVLPCLTHLACAYRHGTSSITAVTCLPLLLAERCADQSYIPDNDFSGTSLRLTPVKPKVLIVELYLSNGSPDATMFLMERLGLGKSPLERRRPSDPRLVSRPGVPLTPRRWVDYVMSDVMWTTAEQEIKLQA